MELAATLPIHFSVHVSLDSLAPFVMRLMQKYLYKVSVNYSLAAVKLELIFVFHNYSLLIGRLHNTCRDSWPWKDHLHCCGSRPACGCVDYRTGGGHVPTDYHHLY